MAVRFLVVVVMALGAWGVGAPGVGRAQVQRDEATFGGVARWFRRALRGPREPYALDETPRYLSDGESMDCASIPLETYRGETVRYRGVVRVHPAFVDRLSRFEQVVQETAVQIYGRAPRRIQHAGTFNCRTVRGRQRRISEHSLGNAIDVKGFEFGPLTRAQRADAPEDLPRSLRRGFTVTVGRHWATERERDQRHRDFLRRLTERLESERVFRAMIGPSHPRHRNHFHFDVGPYRYNWL